MLDSRIYTKAGPLGIYRGQLPTLLREGQGMGIYVSQQNSPDKDFTHSHP
jgi:hypothetical protein